MAQLRKSLDEMNSDIKQWSDDTKSELIGEIDSLGIKRYKYSRNPLPLRKALKRSLRKRFDVIDRVSFSMPRSAIFVHKGVSRGHTKNNPRQAKEWYTPVINKRIEPLADIVANGQGNLIVNGLNIK